MKKKYYRKCVSEGCNTEFESNVRTRNRCYFCKGSFENYGLTGPEKVKLLKEEQNNKCAICEKEIQFSSNSDIKGTANIDHDHNIVDKHYRGFLCNPCNVGIGHFKHDPNIIKSAIKYLEDWNELL